MISSHMSAIRKVGGIDGLSRTEQDVLAYIEAWKRGRDGWRHGRRDSVARYLKISVRSVSRALASLHDQKVIDLARWRYGIAVQVTVAVKVTGAEVMRALVRAKKDRVRMKDARGQIWRLANKVWQKCQCCQDGNTLTPPSSFSLSEPVESISIRSMRRESELATFTSLLGAIDFSRGKSANV